MVTEFIRPRDVAEALSLLSSRPEVLALGGGTQLLSGAWKDKRFAALALEGLVSRDLVRKGASLEIGAGATFQNLVDSKLVPGPLKAAASDLVDRNIRNRATLGGNLGADRPCSSLIPILLALEAGLVLLDGHAQSLESWLVRGTARRGIVARVSIPIRAGTLVATARWSRSSSDPALLGCAVAFRLESGMIRGLRVALGGLGEHSRRQADIESLFEGRPLADRDAIETAVLPLLEPQGDFRAGPDFKRQRLAGLVAEALLGATDIMESGS